MNLHKKMSICLSVIFLLSIIMFCIAKHNHPTISNFLIAMITGAFISIYTSLVSYLHIKEEFFNNLFFTGAFINSNYEQIKQLIFNLDEKSNLKYAINTLTGYSDTIARIISNINFDLYSSFLPESEEEQLLKKIHAIYITTNKAIVLAINEIEISYKNIELNQLKINSLLHPCSYCNIPFEQRPLREKCTGFVEYQNNINILNNNIIKLNKYIKDAIKVLLENTENLQSEYINTMNCLYCKTKSKIKWQEVIKANKDNIRKTMKEYVERSINSQSY